MATEIFYKTTCDKPNCKRHIETSIDKLPKSWGYAHGYTNYILCPKHLYEYDEQITKRYLEVGKLQSEYFKEDK